MNPFIASPMRNGDNTTTPAADKLDTLLHHKEEEKASEWERNEGNEVQQTTK